jgi:hypothetical protein
VSFPVIDDNPLIVRLLQKRGLLDDAGRKQLHTARKRFLNSAEESLVMAEILARLRR